MTRHADLPVRVPFYQFSTLSPTRAVSGSAPIQAGENHRVQEWSFPNGDVLGVFPISIHHSHELLGFHLQFIPFQLPECPLPDIRWDRSPLVCDPFTVRRPARLRDRRIEWNVRQLLL